jgi:hypothetical protein
MYMDVTATEPAIIHQAFVQLVQKLLPSRKSVQEKQE